MTGEDTPGRRSLTQERSHTQGSVSVEAIIIVPIFFAVLMAIVQASLWVYASALAQAAAEDGARAGVGIDARSAQAGVTVAIGIVESSGALENYEVTTASTASSLTVIVRGQSPSVIPWVRFEVQESATLPWQWP